MGFVERKTTYFNKPGHEHTSTVLNLARTWAINNGLKDVVIASSTGETGALASNIFKEFNSIDQITN